MWGGVALSGVCNGVNEICGGGPIICICIHTHNMIMNAKGSTKYEEGDPYEEGGTSSVYTYIYKQHGNACNGVPEI